MFSTKGLVRKQISNARIIMSKQALPLTLTLTYAFFSHANSLHQKRRALIAANDESSSKVNDTSGVAFAFVGSERYSNSSGKGEGHCFGNSINFHLSVPSLKLDASATATFVLGRANHLGSRVVPGQAHMMNSSVHVLYGVKLSDTAPSE